MANGQDQFDGKNPVAGYTLFLGKDGSSFYLKGENLAESDIKARVAKLRSGAPSTVAPEEGGGIDIGELQRGTMAQARQTARRPLQLAVTPEERIGRHIAPQPTPAERMSGALGERIARQNVEALRAGRPEAVAPATTRMAKTALDYGRAAFTPQGAALAVVGAGAHTNPVTAGLFDAALLGYGGYNALANLPDAMSGNPDALENVLLNTAAALPAAPGAAGGARAARGAVAKNLLYEPGSDVFR